MCSAHSRQLIRMVAGLAAGAFLATMLSAAVADTTVPRPEHPRPDAQRDNWQSLNGSWQFEIDPQGDGEARGLTSGKNLASTIIVPFCPESKLSGIGNIALMKYVWYRRMIELPPSMMGKRIRLHFDGVDYRTWVYVNSKLAGTHVGGSAAFAMDITRLLKGGANELVVRVLDDTTCGLQPTGKQSHDTSHGCVYTRTTGIWQPVWLEAVGASFVQEISVVPDPDHSRVLIEAAIDGRDANLNLTAEAFLAGKRVGMESAPAVWRNHRLVLNLSERQLWEPGSPTLYDLKLSLCRGSEKIDELKSYFGLRKVTIDGRRFLINGKPIFQRLILDQGFYPDGIWTAPSDAALKHDIEMSMAAGYNGARLHQKVFEPRFLYWADRLGYLIWGEFPSWGFNHKPEGYAPYVDEWIEVLRRDRNHPSIIGWCPFNETGVSAGELQQVIWNVTKAVDPTRPALETSGYTHTVLQPDVLDMHDYDGNGATLRKRWMEYFTASNAAPAAPARYGISGLRAPDRGVPFMISEIGGIGWGVEGGWGYGAGPQTLDAFYARYQGTLDALLDNPNLFGFCYTQLTDVEQERNGLYFYDRRPKFDLGRLKAITTRQAAYERGEPQAPSPGLVRTDVRWNVLVGAIQDGSLAQPYRYATQMPPVGWIQEGFDDHGWKSGMAPFGRDSRHKVNTPWTSSDIYLRRTFQYDGSAFNSAAAVIFYDEDTEIYVNGQKILGVQNYVTNYEQHDVTAALRKALRKGPNTLAIHTHQTVGGQYIDLALLIEGNTTQ